MDLGQRHVREAARFGLVRATQDRGSRISFKNAIPYSWTDENLLLQIENS